MNEKKSTQTDLPASLRSAVSAFVAMDVMSAAAAQERAGGTVIHMEVGEPGAPAPRVVREAAIRALEAGRVSYTEALGRPTLRARIAAHCRDAYGVDVSAERVVVTTGSSAGFILAFLACFDPGARIAISEPGYPAYRNILEALGLVPVPLTLTAASHYVVTADMIAAADAAQKLDGALLMSPANPSGTMMDATTLRDVAQTCESLRIRFISDEIYHGLTYGRPAHTALEFSDQALVVNSFSKYFCMTGWRVGWLIVPDNLVRPIERLQQNLSISVPYLSQVAAEAAFDARDELEAIKAGYARNREILLNELPGLGLGHMHPVDGAFYIYADIGHLTNDSTAFCAKMLKEAGVAATPGLDFDRSHGNRTLRMSFAGSEADVLEAVRRLKGWRALPGGA
ncbi:pyridoxal phosphate-dependent aminotransferase [Methylovirgula sp. 4M-Z18]|uniref:pyridoxal phosphate-dependent aminotransferase n=1 Tax=Methylovirgula sp. 4M-Z18 TaxID=2293567 RepID=UPI000E2EACCB|nr:aminotransferase class I/II-fold pyridoxal phosphate-dependent enzyme [Methylovirgula sp. 4M-Z18]RFB81542.1 aminotransferase class I/II-fold pyridoxal phosphate-dependent enzyme [Methylovirgula sp. 4M-Z18]